MLTIEIVSDVVCPWCFIGLRRLDRAIAAVQDDVPQFSPVKRWRPFFLNPQTPPDGEPYLPFLVRKFGSQEHVDSLFARVREAGLDYGLDYHFEKIRLRANTLQAHRLIHWAQQQGDAQALVERLFVGQFQLGEHVGDRAVLVHIAGECGYDAEAVRQYLASDADTDLVRQQEREARVWGVNAVPTFVVDRKVAVAGAENPLVLAAAIRRVLAGGA
jgi:predicted DsbA family dithiol-disulfide isomerase